MLRLTTMGSVGLSGTSAGFHPGSGAERERWRDATGDRLRRKAVAAAALIQRADTDGDHGLAIEHARWLVDVVPCDEPADASARGALTPAGN
jgi:hypothetical protein